MRPETWNENENDIVRLSKLHALVSWMMQSDLIRIESREKERIDLNPMELDMRKHMLA